MRLSDLEPYFLGAGGPGVFRNGQPVAPREGVGLTFNCPCGCDRLMYVAFTNPMDGGQPHINPGEPTWQREGDTFDTLTLSPSILRLEGCKWHGFIRNGEVLTV